MKFFENLISDEQGATAIEYGLIAALIAVAAITAMQGLGTEMSTTFNTVSDKMGGDAAEGQSGESEGGGQEETPTKGQAPGLQNP